MRVNLIVESHDSNRDTDIKNVTAIMKTEKNLKSYKYIDEVSKTFIEIFENSVIISREGNVKSKMVLKEGIYTPFDYSTPYLDVTFDLLTKKLEFLENGFKTSYVISQNGDFVNEINLSIIEK